MPLHTTPPMLHGTPTRRLCSTRGKATNESRSAPCCSVTLQATEGIQSPLRRRTCHGLPSEIFREQQLKVNHESCTCQGLLTSNSLFVSWTLRSAAGPNPATPDGSDLERRGPWTSRRRQSPKKSSTNSVQKIQHYQCIVGVGQTVVKR